MVNHGEQHNVVLVTVDSMRADRCGFMGYERGLTPALDYLSEGGIVFEKAIAPGPATPESMPVIFTGSYPAELADHDHLPELERERQRIRHHMNARDTLAEKLSRRGYTTGAFTPNPFTSRYFDFDQGFDHFEDFMGESRTRGSIYEGIFEDYVRESDLASALRPVFNLLQREEAFKPWESFYDEIVAWTEQAEEPYFLWIMLMDVHNPYLVPKEYRSQSAWAMWHGNWRMFREDKQSPFSEAIENRLLTAYDDAIRYVDDFFDQITSDVDDATFIVTADHGEAFGEHGHYGHEPYLHEENVHVPLILFGNGIEGSKRIEEPVSIRTIPRLSTRLAAGDTEIVEETSTSAIAKTPKGGALALCQNGWQFIENGSTGQLHPFGDSEIDDETIKNIEQDCLKIMQYEREIAAEYRRIIGATQPLLQEGHV